VGAALGPVSGYEPFARFYDRVMGDAGPTSAWVLAAISRWRPGASSLLELGCGTGSVLAGLTSLPALWGLDASAAMLAVARRKVPRAQLVLGDLAAFELGRRFDVVACVFDTLNHVTSLDGWVGALECAAAHLEPGGLLVLDVNTVGRLAELVEQPTRVQEFDGGTLLMDVLDEGAGLTTWTIRVVERLPDGRHELITTRVQELAVPLDIVRAALSADFEVLEEDDGSSERPSDDSARVRFVARRRD
jgi:SAM-dependent methyltransferase